MKKILLIHGWNYENYYGCNKEAWHNRMDFINTLKTKFEVIYFDLPGFGKNKTPIAKEWNLNNYATYIENFITNNDLDIDYILGYSFGGAVAVRWKTKYNHSAKLILVSPVIIRNNIVSTKFIKTLSILKPIRNSIRNFYLVHIIKNNEMRYGNSFLKNTYQKIVRENLIKELQIIKPNELTLIYGNKDNMVNPNLVYSNVSKDYQKRITFIENGTHDIANTNKEEILDIIIKM